MFLFINIQFEFIGNENREKEEFWRILFLILYVFQAPLSRRGDIKERPNSNKSGSLVTAKGNRGSSKKKQDGKKADAPEKTPKKEDRSKKGESSFDCK